MKKLIFIPLYLLLFYQGISQIIPASRITDWSIAGLEDSVPSYSNAIDVLTVGLVNDSISSNNSAFQALLQSMNSPTVIYFPPGIYFFNQPISLPDSVILRGAGADSTVLKFDFGGVASDAINIVGSKINTPCYLSSDVQKNQYQIQSAGCNILPGWFHLVYNDSLVMGSTWAYGSGGQMLKVSEVNDSILELQYPLRLNVPLSLTPRIYPVQPRTGVGIECLKIVRNDATVNQSTNVTFRYAINCWMIGVESELTNFGHTEMTYSSNILIKGNYFHHAHAYGGGGQGYGTVIQYSSGQCLIENNVFEHLRHSVLLQAGSNGNVIAYNYSFDPYWSQFPNNSAGDLVLHGNYPYLNLFEGNIAQNIVVDNSHYKNGHFNTFFRNRAQLYGIVMSSGTNTDSTNFLGNEVTNTGFLLGNYALAGLGNFTYGNNIKGTITPAGTNSIPEISLYRNQHPGYWMNTISWPSIGAPAPYNQLHIPAFERWEDQLATSCFTNEIYDPGDVNLVSIPEESSLIYPNPTSDFIHVKDKTSVITGLFDLHGKKLADFNVSSSELNITHLQSGVYIVSIQFQSGEKRMMKVIKN